MCVSRGEGRKGLLSRALAKFTPLEKWIGMPIRRRIFPLGQDKGTTRQLPGSFHEDSVRPAPAMPVPRQIDLRGRILIEETAAALNHPVGEIGHARILKIEKKGVTLQSLGKSTHLGEKKTPLGINEIQHFKQVSEGLPILPVRVGGPHHGGNDIATHYFG